MYMPQTNIITKLNHIYQSIGDQLVRIYTKMCLWLYISIGLLCLLFETLVLLNLFVLCKFIQVNFLVTRAMYSINTSIFTCFDDQWNTTLIFFFIKENVFRWIILGNYVLCVGIKIYLWNTTLTSMRLSSYQYCWHLPMYASHYFFSLKKFTKIYESNYYL